mmetsp:Transcript_1483/g.3602  ORF Transcript_1483/g.3602 Transcript_1483/m.3602 type:complete len:138 (-) Transcript_1483:2211-2624(-)
MLIPLPKSLQPQSERKQESLPPHLPCLLCTSPPSQPNNKATNSSNANNLGTLLLPAPNTLVHIIMTISSSSSSSSNLTRHPLLSLHQTTICKHKGCTPMTAIRNAHSIRHNSHHQPCNRHHHHHHRQLQLQLQQQQQ